MFQFVLIHDTDLNEIENDLKNINGYHTVMIYMFGVWVCMRCHLIGENKKILWKKVINYWKKI